MPGYRLLTESNAKTRKGEALGYLTGILYLRPDAKLCPGASAACMAACLFGAGRARIFPAVAAARARRTHYLRDNPEGFKHDLCRDIDLLVKRAARMGLRPALRLNGTSDIGNDWSIGDLISARRLTSDMRPLDDALDLARLYAISQDVTTYEYTKRPELVPGGYVRPWSPRHVTFSFNGQNHDAARRAIEKGAAVAVVYDFQGSRDDRRFPTFGFDPAGCLVRVVPGTSPYQTIDGDESDARFLDRERFGVPETSGYFVALKLKRTKHDDKARAEGFAV